MARFTATWTVFLLMAVLGSAAAQDLDRAALQASIESGESLSGAQRKALFRARSHRQEGRLAEALGVLGEPLEGPGAPLLQFERAQVLADLGDTAGAQAALQAACAAEPSFARAWLRLGEIAYGSQKYRVAGEAFERGWELSPDRRPELLYYSGVSWLAADLTTEAYRPLTILLSSATDAPLDWYRAWIAAAVEVEEPDVRIVEQLCSTHAADPAAWRLGGRYAAGRTDYESAATYLTVASYLGTFDSEDWRRLGDLYAVIEVPVQAARCYEAAAVGESTPHLRDRERLAGAWVAAHRPEEARAALLAALDQTESRRLWILLADLEYQEENWEAALAAYDKATTIDPAWGRGWLLAGFCARESGHAEEAREYLLRAATFPRQASAARSLLEEMR